MSDSCHGRPAPDGTGAWRDLVALLLLTGLALGLGLGSRSPWWPAESGVALAGSEMLGIGQWRIPQLGGQPTDQPILPVWLSAFAQQMFGSVRAGFLVPTFAAALATMALVWDFARRLSGREAALAAGLLLLITLQFGAAARNGAPDMLLCLFTTLTLYGLLRHLLFGPARGWFLAGSAAAGIGMLAHPMGYLGLLTLVPWAAGRMRGWPACRPEPTPWAAAAAMFLVIAAVPLLLALTTGITGDQAPEGLVARIRGTSGWPEGPGFLLFWWLPLTALAIWLWPRWREALTDGDVRILLLGGWLILAGLVLAFGTDGRSRDFLPLLPAAVLLASPWLPMLSRCRSVRQAALALTFAVPLSVLAFALWPPAFVQAAQTSGEAFPWPFVQWAVLPALGIGILLGPRHPLAAMVLVICGTGVLLSTLGRPTLDDTRSGRDVMALAELTAPAGQALGLLDPDPRFLLTASRPLALAARQADRREEHRAMFAWLADHEGRRLLASGTSAGCFDTHGATLLGSIGLEAWYLLRGGDVLAGCRRGRGTGESIIEWSPTSGGRAAESSARIP